MASVPLIISKQSVHMQIGPAKATQPGIAVVYATNDGQIVYFGGNALTWSQQRAKYRTRYEVDISDHRRTVRFVSTPLPSLDQAHFFEATAEVGFRVSDPAEIVRRNIQDALVIVYGHLTAEIPPIARTFDIEAAAGLETRVNQQYRTEMTLREGLTIFRCVIRVQPDAAARAYIEDQTKVRRLMGLRHQQFELEKADKEHELQLRAREHQARLAREAAEQAALAGMPLDIEGLIKRHLVTHPEDTLQAMEMLVKVKEAEGRQQELFDDRSVSLFHFMVDRQLIQPADVELLRGQALGRIGLTGTPAAPALPTGPGAVPAITSVPAQAPAPAPSDPQAWDDPLPPADPGQALGAIPGTVTSAPAAAPAEAPLPDPVNGVIPVYVVLEESPAVAAYLGGLNDGLRSLHTALAGEPAVAAGIRLSVIGFAENAQPRLDLAAVRPGSPVPSLRARGAVSYAAVFKELLSRIPGDVEKLKATSTRVHRPLVFFLGAGPPIDVGGWTADHQRLVDRATQRYAPNIIACGVAGAAPAAIVRIATGADFAFTALPEVPPATTGLHFAAFLTTTVMGFGRGLLSGNPSLSLQTPSGFRKATSGSTP